MGASLRRSKSSKLSAAFIAVFLEVFSTCAKHIDRVLVFRWSLSPSPQPSPQGEGEPSPASLCRPQCQIAVRPHDSLLGERGPTVRAPQCVALKTSRNPTTPLT